MLHGALVDRAERRLLAHAILDEDHLSYKHERQSAAYYESLEAPRAIGSIEDEARHLVSEMYQTSHASLDASTEPLCQLVGCVACHRVLALVQASAFCGNRAEYGPILRWIMDPEYLE